MTVDPKDDVAKKIAALRQVATKYHSLPSLVAAIDGAVTSLEHVLLLYEAEKERADRIEEQLEARPAGQPFAA